MLTITCSYGQISPGDLTIAHAKYEGLSNCTLCHEIGKKVTNSKCLECHKKINTLITKNKGLHSNIEVKAKDCFQCHSEHHGRKFEMIRFDKENFNHNLTGYKLEGKHEEIDCKKCHKSDFIKNIDLKKRPTTFLGLDDKCISCHNDVHQNTLSTNKCTSCHNTKSFSPATKFDHNLADFKLKGKHTKVDCKECHKIETKNGKDFQNFNHVAFNNCNTCHDNPHKNKITTACNQCHTEESFNVFKGKGRFNHNTTNFTLKGRHKKINCFSCHKKTTNPLTVFQDKLLVQENNCVSCHTDSHEGKFGIDCAKCHNENSFHSKKTRISFNHQLTDYPLIGKHQNVDCKQCHNKGKLTDKIAFNSCNNCHTDYHKGEFTKNNVTPDCKECHTLQDGFESSLFTIENHKTTQFPLVGAHEATPCFSCHLNEKENRWTFKDKDTKCMNCHIDIHENYIDKKYYPNQACQTCHNNDSWASANFNHNKTNFKLQGKHLTINCKTCHLKEPKNKKTFIQKFKNLDSNCTSCHENKHGNQFAINGKTDCVRCHIFKSWIPEKFDHNTTAFPLEGKHAEIECSQCHLAVVENNKTSLNYKIEKHQCIDCHQ